MPVSWKDTVGGAFQLTEVQNNSPRSCLERNRFASREKKHKNQPVSGDELRRRMKEKRKIRTKVNVQ